MDPMDHLYHQHNLAVMLAARFAQLLGLRVGLSEDPLELNWHMLNIVLPTGEQIAWRLPPGELAGEWPIFEGKCEGYRPEDRIHRLFEFLQDSGIAFDLNQLRSTVDSNHS